MMILGVSSSLQAKKKQNVDQTTSEIKEFSTSKIDKKQVPLKQAPNFSFKYPGNYHVHSYDGQSININDWNPENYTNASMLIRWKKRPFSRQEEGQYLKLGFGKSNVKMLSTKGVSAGNAKTLWAMKAKYDLDKKDPVPMMPPETVKKAKPFTIKPYTTQVERTVVNVRCKTWNVLIDYQAKDEVDKGDVKKQIEEMAKSFHCG